MEQSKAVKNFLQREKARNRKSTNKEYKEHMEKVLGGLKEPTPEPTPVNRHRKAEEPTADTPQARMDAFADDMECIIDNLERLNNGVERLMAILERIAPPEVDDWLTVRGIKAMTKLCDKTIYNAIRSGYLHPITKEVWSPQSNKYKTTTVFNRVEVDEWYSGRYKTGSRRGRPRKEMPPPDLPPM